MRGINHADDFGWANAPRGSKSGGGTTTVQQNGPPPEVLANYQQVYGQAQQAAGAPYTQYPGPTVADFTPAQRQYFQQIADTQGTTQPYIDQAAAKYGQATQPLSSGVPQVDQGLLSGLAPSAVGLNTASTGNYNNLPGINFADLPQFSADQISKYQSPYTDQVVEATKRQFADMNAQQNQGVIGNAIAKNAWGGDRASVAQALLAGEQATAQAPVIAGLYNQGYGQALGEFNTQQGLAAQEQQAGAGLATTRAQQLSQLQQAAAQQQLGLLTGQQQMGLNTNQAQAWLNSQAAQGLGALGSESLQSRLAEAGVLGQVGAQQQQQGQALINQPYQQFLAQQAYPFQTTGWLSNIAQGLGGASGGVGSTTTPGASVASQLGGLGVGAAGLVGATGGYGNNGWLTGLLSNSGGSISPSTLASNAAYQQGAFSAAGEGAYGPFQARGGRLERRADGGMLTDIPDMSVSVVPGAQGMGTPPQVQGSPLIKSSTGTTTTTEGGGGQDSIFGTILKTAATIVAGIYGGPAGAAAAGAIGSQVHFADGGSVDPGLLTDPEVSFNVLRTPLAGSGVPGSLVNPEYVGLTPRVMVNGAPLRAWTASRMAPVAKATAEKSPEQLGAQLFQQMFESNSNAGEGESGGGEARGGRVRGFRDGGDTDDNALDWSPTQGLVSEPEGLDWWEPTAGERVSSDDDALPVPPIPPATAGPPSAAAPSGVATQPATGGLASTPTALAPQSEIAATPVSSSRVDPWLAIAAAGFGTAAGRSPYAAQNIGAGALAGLKEYQNEKALAARERTADALAGYRADRTKEAATHNRQTETQAAQSLAARIAEATARLKQGDVRIDLTREGNEERGRHNRATEGATTDRQASIDSRFQQRMQQQADKLQETGEYHRAMAKLRADGMDEVNARSALANATRMMAADLTGKLKFADALEMARRALPAAQGADKRLGTAPSTSASPSASDPLAAARAAIAKGAPRAAVEQRLRENGIDPSGL